MLRNESKKNTQKRMQMSFYRLQLKLKICGKKNWILLKQQVAQQVCYFAVEYFEVQTFAIS